MVLALTLLAVQQQPFAGWPSSRDVNPHRQEGHLRNVRQLTFGGQNAEAYWSHNGDRIVFQSRQPGFADEQIFVMEAGGTNKRLVSTGKGRCTCGYFSPDDRWVYFSSTHATNEGAQKPIDMSKGYVWMVNPEFRMYRQSLGEALFASGNHRDSAAVPPDISLLAKPQAILARPGSYIAETTVAPNGRFMTFTSDFEGDLEIYRADLNGKNIKRLTHQVGYDGGPFVSWDGAKIVYRRDAIESDAELKDYRELLGQHLVRPSKLEIWIMDSDGRNKRQVTKLGCASFAPFLHPNGKRIIFASNFGDKKGREFELWTIGVDGHGLERITYEADFDGFPMWSRDGKHLVWASNRNGKTPGETNIFVADWVE